MLSFPTYNIPETLDSETQDPNKWLWMIVPQPLNPAGIDLLQKISSALKTDFESQVHCFQQDPIKNGSLTEALHTGVKLIISFGVAPSSLGIWIDLPSPGIRFLEEFAFILSTTLEDLSKNANAKKELWRCMQLFLETR